ncbi:hypothetical protein HaLaN_25199, partial [Haematococcus lacustris]
MAKKKLKKDPGKKQKASRSSQGKQRQERRDGWTTRRRQLRVIASLLVLRIFLTCLVGYPTPGFPSAPVPH